MISGADGYVYYDKEPYVKYRQHGNNQVGSNRGIVASARRLMLALKGRYKRWNDMNINALLNGSQHITSENKQKLLNFKEVKNGNLWHRVRYSNSLTTLRFGRIDKIAFIILLFLGKV